MKKGSILLIIILFIILITALAFVVLASGYISESLKCQKCGNQQFEKVTYYMAPGLVGGYALVCSKCGEYPKCTKCGSYVHKKTSDTAYCDNCKKEYKMNLKS